MRDRLKKLANAYREMGGVLYLVGGAVRDALLLKEPKDADICGALTPEAAQKAFESAGAKVKAKYARLGTLRLNMDGFDLEYTSFRADFYADGHRPASVVFTGSLNEDALRRDFTIGSLYQNILTDAMLDPTGQGFNDLRAGILRPIGENTLKEDGLRILRLARFCAQLGFDPAEGAIDIARKHISLLEYIEKSRIRDEMSLILTAEHALHGMEILETCGAMAALFPGKNWNRDFNRVPASLPLRLAALFWPEKGGLKGLSFPQKMCFDMDVAAELNSLSGRELRRMAAKYPEALAIAAELSHDRSIELRELAALDLPRSERDIGISGHELRFLLNIENGPELGFVKKRLWEYNVLNPNANHADLIREARRGDRPDRPSPPMNIQGE